MSGQLPRLSDRDPIVTEARVATFPFQHDWQELVEYTEGLGEIVSDGDKGDIVVSSAGTVWTVDSNVITNAKAADMAQSTIKGRAEGAGTGDPTDLTPAQAREVIELASGDSPTFAGATFSATSPLLIVKDSDSTGTSIAFTMSFRGSDDVGVYSISRVAGAGTVFYGNSGAHVFNVAGAAVFTLGAAAAAVTGTLSATGAASFASLALTADLPVTEGGTGASTAAGARTNLGVTATGADTTYAFRANNLSDLASAAAARDNLDLGTADSPAFAGLTVTGDTTLGDAETDTVTVAGMLRLTNDSTLLLGSTNHAFQIGTSAAQNLAFDDSKIQSRANGAASILTLNGSGGSVTLAEASVTFDSVNGHTIAGDLTFSSGTEVRLDNVSEATLASTAHAFQIGLTASTNLAFDTTEIQARSNGAASTLELNPHGGSVSFGGAASLTSATLSGLLTLNITAASRESALKATVTDAGNDAFYLANFTATASRFQPAITGFVDSADNLSSLNFSGAVLAARDTAGDGGLGVVNFRAAIVDSATDPVNGSFSALTNRTLFSFRNQATNILSITPTAVNLGSGIVLQVNGTQVLTSRRTGWTADTGTAKRTANATYAGTAEAAYTQATIQALMDAVRDATRTIKALKDDFITHGAIGT